MSIGKDREKYLDDLSSKIVDAGINSKPELVTLMKKQEFFYKAFNEDRMSIKEAEKAWWGKKYSENLEFYPPLPGDQNEERGIRYLTFAMVVLLIGLIASFIVYYNDKDREAAFWVGVGLSALLFILLVYYFFM